MNARTIAMILGFAATVCFVSLGFDIMPDRTATFLGVVLSMAAGFAWWLGATASAKED